MQVCCALLPDTTWMRKDLLKIAHERHEILLHDMTYISELNDIESPYTALNVTHV
jgi:hypothetical protein